MVFIYALPSSIHISEKGFQPLTVNIDNKSEYATFFEWFLNDESTGELPTTHFDSSGVYVLTLVAWEDDLSCADTISKTIIVLANLISEFPNVFTPNGDGINDYFNMKINLPVYYSVSILNRWGNVVFEREGNLEKGTHNLWDGTLQNGKMVSNGTCFYTISLKLEGDFDCKLVECEVRENGFVEVVGR